MHHAQKLVDTVGCVAIDYLHIKRTSTSDAPYKYRRVRRDRLSTHKTNIQQRRIIQGAISPLAFKNTQKLKSLTPQGFWSIARAIFPIPSHSICIIFASSPHKSTERKTTINKCKGAKIMNISGTSMVAFGFAALLGVTGFAYLEARNQLDKTTDNVVAIQSERDGLKQQADSLKSERDGLKQQADSLQSERDKLNKQINSWQSELSTRNNRISALEGQLNKSRDAILAYERQIKTISVCLQGIAEGNNQLKQENQAGAIITFSSVASQCREADTILEQQNSSGSRQEQPDTNVGSVL